MAPEHENLADQVEDENYLRECVANTQFTVEWILSALNANDEKWKKTKNMKRKVTEITFEDISAGKGFVSRVIKLTIHFADDGENYLVVLKVPSTAALQRGITEATEKAQQGLEEEEKSELILDQNVEAIKMFEQIHERECIFYSKFPNVEHLPVPRVFKTEPWRIAEKKEGAILMECLTEVAMTGELFVGLTHQQILQIFDAITHFQAHVIVNTERSFIETALVSSMTDEKMTEVFIKMLAQSLEDKPRCKEMYLRMQGPFKDPNLWQNTTLGHKKLNITPVLSHGDLWTNNIMWKKNPDGKPSDQLHAIIDWQVLRAGTPPDDLARVLVNCCDGEYRREHEYGLLDRYYEQLCTLLKKHKLKPPFTMEEVIRSYRLAVIYQTIMLITIIPMFVQAQMLNPAELPEVKKAKEDVLWKRVELAMEDAVRYGEAYFPEMM